MKKYLIDYPRMLERELELMKESTLLASNKATILEYKRYSEIQNHSIPRIQRALSILRYTGLFLKKPFSKATKKDFENMVIWLQQTNKKTGTIDTYKNVLKVFYKWSNNGTCPETVSWMKVSKAKYQRLPEELLTLDDVKKLLEAIQNLRDRALVAVLWESGARIGEIGTLELRHIAFDDFGCQIMVDGKTGQRRIRLVSSAPYLLEWINRHPTNSNSHANLWQNTRSNNESISHRRICTILERAAAKAGIQKPINPHHFRHSRATYMAQFLTEAQMKEYFGWVQDSDMAARYVHLSGKQVDDAILKMYGLKKQEKQSESCEPCPRCKTINEESTKYCKKCWLPLTPQAQNEVEEIRQKDQEGMLAVMKLLEMAKTNPGVIQEAITRAQQVEKEVI